MTVPTSVLSPSPFTLELSYKLQIPAGHLTQLLLFPTCAWRKLFLKNLLSLLSFFVLQNCLTNDTTPTKYLNNLKPPLLKP